MAKVPFVTKEQLDEIVKKYPTPFHLYDEKGIRETARGLYKAFSWNKGFKEYFAVKATPNPTILKILKRRRMRNRLLIFNRTYDVRSLWIRWKRDHVLF